MVGLGAMTPSGAFAAASAASAAAAAALALPALVVSGGVGYDFPLRVLRGMVGWLLGLVAIELLLLEDFCSNDPRALYCCRNSLDLA